MLFGPGKYPSDAYVIYTKTYAEVQYNYSNHSIKMSTVPVQYIKTVYKYD